MSTPAPSAAVIAAQQRRVGAGAASEVRFQWFLREVSDKISITMRERVRVATEHLKSKVVRNISRPVTKGKGPFGGRVVTNRSLPGEYPKAETTSLLKGIFSDVIDFGNGTVDGIVGTPLDYGLILETRMNRSFLVRTLGEEQQTINRILTGPIT